MQILLKKGDTGGTVPLAGIPEKATVEDLYNKVQREIGPDGDWYLLFLTKNLDGYKGKTLEFMKMKNNSMVALVFRTQGGPNLTPLPGWIRLTTDPCMILFIEPDPGSYHAKMRCGHVISPEAMVGHVEDTMKKGGYRFTCPGCNVEWPYDVVKHVGCVTDEQQRNIESKLVEVFMERAMGIQKCPSCLNYCHRVNPNNPRVVCAVCTKKQSGTLYEFCWCCLRKWLTGGTKDCGNPECDGSDPRNQYLKNCEKTVIQYTDITCPLIRACPNCGVLIHHTGGCKTMTCEFCRKGFCFVCLGPMVNGALKCGNHVVKCAVAPAQQF